MRRTCKTLLFISAAAVLLTLTLPAAAQEGAATEAPGAVAAAADQDAISPTMFALNNLWIMIAGCMVFIMHLGFATLESGLTRAKNNVNILFKNTMIVCIGILMYGLVGFSLMYPGDFNGFLGFGGFQFLGLGPHSLGRADLFTAEGYGLDMTTFTDFFFQAMFAATAATIVSGAVAERIRLAPFLIFTALFVGISYNITGSWKWGGGWLWTELSDGSHAIAGLGLPGFYDFAGSTIVHSVGGWGALLGALILGPRLGKYSNDGTVNPIPGHNMTLATIGVLLLWFGWFGFNGGSVLSADPAKVSLVLVTTSIAAAAGGVAAAITSWSFGGKPDITMALNGILAGLVGITAGADLMAVWEATLIGLIAGALVYFSVLTLDRLRIDDPVGAVSVHLVCGIWGTLAVGLLGSQAGFSQLLSQLTGIGAIGLFTALFAGVVLLALKHTMGLRVSEHEEVEGLDLGEHDMAAYPDFQQTYIKSYHAREL